MFCPNCGTPVSESSRFCPECGTPLGHVSQDSVSDIPPSTNDVPQPHRLGKPAIAAIICCVALLCVAAGVLLFALLPSRGSGNAGQGSNAGEQSAGNAEQERRQNPSSVDGAAGPATLKGTLVREEWPTDKTQMAWSAVGYFLEFDSPVTVTYAIGGGTQTSTVTRLQVASDEQYAGNANVDLDAQSDPYWEQYVGNYIAVSGKLMNTGNAHCLAEALFVDPVLVEVL